MATQEFLDATRGGSFNNPTDWTALADSWEASAFDAVQTKDWVEVEIESPAIATALVARGIEPIDVSLIVDFFSPSSLPNLEDAIAAIALFKGLKAIGRSVTLPDQRVTVLTTFFQELSDAGIDLVVGPAP